MGGPGDGKPDPKKVYGPKGGKLIEEVILKGKKSYNAAHAFMQMSLDLDKGFDDGVMDYTKDSYSFITKNAYSKNYWQEKGGEMLMSAVYIQDMSKIRPDGSSNAIDLLNNISNASAYDVGHFIGYNGAQFSTTAAFTEGSGLLLNSFKSIRLSPKAGIRTLSRGEMANIWGAGPRIDPTNLPKSVTNDLIEILSGRGNPIIRNGTQAVIQNRSGINPNWVNALEWKIKDIPGSSLNGSRILQHPNGKWGLVIDHNYRNVIQIPTSSVLK